MHSDHNVKVNNDIKNDNDMDLGEGADDDGSAKAVTSPYGNILYHLVNVTHGQFAFTSSDSGQYYKISCIHFNCILVKVVL
nr:transmembrane emp24 domain-containing protein p24delta3-like [Tanacetum cinerariifolium]